MNIPQPEKNYSIKFRGKFFAYILDESFHRESVSSMVSPNNPLVNHYRLTSSSFLSTPVSTSAAFSLA